MGVGCLRRVKLGIPPQGLHLGGAISIETDHAFVRRVGLPAWCAVGYTIERQGTSRMQPDDLESQRPPDPPFTSLEEWHEDLEKLPHVQEIIVQGWTRVWLWMEINARTAPLTFERAVRFHETVWKPVFPQFAGVVRGPNYPYPVRFGRYASGGEIFGAPWQEVDRLCRELFDWSAEMAVHLDSLSADLEVTLERFLDEAVRPLAYFHAKFLNIHPCVNGNGRTARLLLAYFCLRYGLRPFEVERPRIPGYIDQLTAFHDHGKVEPLAELLQVALRPDQWERAGNRTPDE